MTDVALPIALYLGTLVLLAFALRRSPLLTEETQARSSPLDALRGILATAVVCLHFVLTYRLKAEGQWREPDSDLLYNMGVVPVSLFFMITGYLFFGKVYRRTPDWGELLRSRVLRVMPLYLCVVAVVVLFTLIRTHFVIADGQHFMLELLSWELFSGFSLNGLEESGWMTAGAHWTLRYEALFYLALPIIAALFNRRGFGLPLLVSALLVGGLVAAGYHYHVLGARFGLLFLLGFLPVFVKVHRPALLARLRTPLVAALSLALVGYAMTQPDYNLKQMLALALPFAAMAAGNDLFGLLRSRGLKVLGEISYSLYLTHGLLLYGLFTLLNLGSVETLGTLGFMALLPPVLVLACLLSMLSYRWIERPLMHLGRAPRPRHVPA